MYALALYNYYNRKVMALLGALIALSAFAYGGLLLGAVAHAAHRSDAESKIHKLIATVSALESQYLKRTEALSPDAAQTLGFVAPKELSTVFVAAQTLTLAR